MSTIEQIKEFLKEQIEWQTMVSDKMLDLMVKDVNDKDKADIDNTCYMISSGKIFAYEEVLRLIESLENNK